MPELDQASQDAIPACILPVAARDTGWSHNTQWEQGKSFNRQSSAQCWVQVVIPEGEFGDKDSEACL